SSNDENKTIIKPRELRNILAKEHLCKGDVVIASAFNCEFICRIRSTGLECGDFRFYVDKWTLLTGGNISQGPGAMNNFLRFATDKERALLETKQTIETVDPVNSFTGSIPGKITYTREVWVNHYSDQEFHVHKKKSTADHLANLNGD